MFSLRQKREKGRRGLIVLADESSLIATFDDVLEFTVHMFNNKKLWVLLRISKRLQFKAFNHSI